VPFVFFFALFVVFFRSINCRAEYSCLKRAGQPRVNRQQLGFDARFPFQSVKQASGLDRLTA
jgi:hypothetical protein